jgi:hypothetical protein
MTDRDDSAEGFLGRWSRRKIEGADEASDAVAKAPAPDVSPPVQSGLPDRHGDSAKTPARATPLPEFDLARLPSLDSITAATDIRAFLLPGVPKDLARAALRRAWSADPAIRDFVGLAENAWDFTDPTAMPGFGELPAGYDVKKLIAQIFGEHDKPAEDGATGGKPADPQASGAVEEIAATASPAEAAPSAAPVGESSAPSIAATENQVAQVHRDNNIASHNSGSGDAVGESKSRRHHGGALPQ